MAFTLTQTQAEKIAALPTETIELVLANLDPGTEAAEPTPDFPLAGLIVLTGVGKIPARALRDELNERKGEGACRHCGAPNTIHEPTGAIVTAHRFDCPTLPGF